MTASFFWLRLLAFCMIGSLLLVACGDIVIPTEETPTIPRATRVPSPTATPIPLSAVELASGYQQLPEIRLTVASALVAAPSAPDTSLLAETIPAGEHLRVVGMDQDAAWLLVLYRDSLGWIPSFYSSVGTGAMQLQSLDMDVRKTCNYVDASLAPGQEWVSTVSGQLLVRGLLYRPQPIAPPETALPAIAITGGGNIAYSGVDHIPLETAGELLLFRFILADMQQGSRVQFQLPAFDGETNAFHAVFFTGDCEQGASEAPAAPADEQPGAPNTDRPTEWVGIVNSNGLNVRSQPGPDYDIVAVLKRGARVEVLSSQDVESGSTWLEIRLSEGRSGWVNGRFVDRAQ